VEERLPLSSVPKVEADELKPILLLMGGVRPTLADAGLPPVGCGVNSGSETGASAEVLHEDEMNEAGFTRGVCEAGRNGSRLVALRSFRLPPFAGEADAKVGVTFLMDFFDSFSLIVCAQSTIRDRVESA